MLVAGLMLSACKPPTPEEQLDNVGSWLATADMTAQAWLNHTTPEKYTRQTLELSSKTIRQTADDLLESPPPGINGGTLDSLLRRSASRVDRISGLVVNRNAPAVRMDLDSLRGEKKAVHEIAERLKASQ